MADNLIRTKLRLLDLDRLNLLPLYHKHEIRPVEFSSTQSQPIFQLPGTLPQTTESHEKTPS